MAAERIPTNLAERLPAVRGRLDFEEPLARFTWFKVGGPAEVLFRPIDEDDLADILAGLGEDVPVTVIGNASNLLVRDGGVRGVVIRLGAAFTTIEISGDHVHAGAGAADLNVARKARDAGLAGLEFMSGIPGTVGGAVRMNAGAYGREIKDVLVCARLVERSGARRRIDAVELGFEYRGSAIPAGAIVTSAEFAGQPGDIEEISRRMAEIQEARQETQPVRTPTGGSTFRNPPGARAWELIEKAGCRGLRRGGAMVSELHCNFLVNTGAACAADIEGLGEEVRRRVAAETGVTLEWEIKRIGDADPAVLGEVGR